MEYKCVTLHLVFLLELAIGKDKAKQTVSFLYGEVIRCPILRCFDIEQHEGVVLRVLVGICPLHEYAQVDLDVRQTVGSHRARLVILRVGHSLEDGRADIYQGELVSEVVAELYEQVVGEGVDVELEKFVLQHHHLVALETQQSVTKGSVMPESG